MQIKHLRHNLAICFLYRRLAYTPTYSRHMHNMRTYLCMYSKEVCLIIQCWVECLIQVGRNTPIVTTTKVMTCKSNSNPFSVTFGQCPNHINLYVTYKFRQCGDLRRWLAHTAHCIAQIETIIRSIKVND